MGGVVVQRFMPDRDPGETRYLQRRVQDRQTRGPLDQRGGHKAMESYRRTRSITTRKLDTAAADQHTHETVQFSGVHCLPKRAVLFASLGKGTVTAP